MSTVFDHRSTVRPFDLLYTSATAISASFHSIQHQRTFGVRGRIYRLTPLPPTSQLDDWTISRLVYSKHPRVQYVDCVDLRDCCIFQGWQWCYGGFVVELLAL